MKTTVLLHADEIARVLDRLACQIMERHGDCEQTVLLGIQRRGVDLVRLGKVLKTSQGKLPFGTRINLYSGRLDHDARPPHHRRVQHHHTSRQ